MKTTILTTIEEVEGIAKEINLFADIISSSLPFHRLQVPLIWWKHFSSGLNCDFGSKRGRNFFGAKSWLKRISFILVENEGDILGFAPLFISEAVLRGQKEPVKLLSFIPDSGLVFYQDLLIHPNFRKKIVAKIFECIENLLISEDLLLFLGHIPEDSLNIDFLNKEIDFRLKSGWYGGQTVNCWRGGVYPWNIAKICAALKAALRALPPDYEELHGRAKKLIKSLESQTSALTLFKSTREVLKKETLEILEIFKDRDLPEKILKSLEDVFETKPVIYPFKNLPKTTDEFYSALSSGKRYYFRRYLKKFLAEGGSFENIDPNKITISDIGDYLRLHAERWGEESASLLTQTEGFHKDLSLSMAKGSYFRLFFANYKDERIAALAAFDIGNRREFYYSGRSMKNVNLRAGKILVLYSVLDAIEKGFEIYDFGYGDDDYKFDFTKTYRTLQSFILTRKNKLPDLNKLFPLYEQIVL